MAVGRGGMILPTKKKIKSLNITTYKSLYSNKARIGSYPIGYWKSQIKILYNVYPFEM